MVEEYPDGVKVIHDFLSITECALLIENSERQGYEEAAIDTGNGQEIFKDIRNNDRLFFDDEKLAKKLFEKISLYLPDSIDGWKLYSLNERFRFYRYENEQYFKWHRDGSFKRSYFEVSKITFMIYLNDNYTGGETEFRGFKVQPKAGSALIFPHQLMHQGSKLHSGVKYVLRTDVMYDKA